MSRNGRVVTDGCNEFINKTVNNEKYWSIFDLKKQYHIADPKHILNFLGQIKLRYEEHEEFLKMQQEKI